MKIRNRSRRDGKRSRPSPSTGKQFVHELRLFPYVMPDGEEWYGN